MVAAIFSLPQRQSLAELYYLMAGNKLLNYSMSKVFVQVVFDAVQTPVIITLPSKIMNTRKELLKPSDSSEPVS